MSEQMKFIVKELNASLGRNYDLIKFDALDEKQLLQVLVDLLANFNAGEKLDIREDDSETVSVRLLEMLASVKYRPPGTLEPARFRAQLLAGDARTIHHVLHWLLTNKEQVKKTAYLAKYLKIPDIPSDVARNNTVQDLLDLYQNLIDEFKDVHKRTRILEKENASEIINDIKEMAVERDIVIKRLENVQVNLVDVHNKEEMLNVGKNLRVQQEKAKELENQYEAQQSQLKTASDQLKRYLNVIHGQSATPKTANDVIKHLMDEIQLNGYLVKEKLPQESSNLQKELNIMQNIATEQHPTRSDLIVVQDKIAAVNSELESLVQRRLASSGPQEDKLAPFRQQAAVIRRNKEASAARAHELAAALKDHEATLADLQSQYETYASCLKTNISLDKNTQSSTKDIFISLESQGIVSVSDGHVELAHPLKEEWRVLGAHYAGPASVALLAALLAAALPLAGLFWCCCYWCRAGRRRRPFDRKYDACLKGLLAILLIALLTLFLFGVVCAFATDSQVESGTRESAGSVRAGLRDAQTFLNATQAHARWLLVNNYRELERRLSAMLTSSGLTISVQLGEFSRAVSVTTLTGMVRRLDGVRDDLRAVRDHTADLRARAERLNAVLRSVKGQLLQTLARCDQPQCVRLQEKHKIGQLDTEIHYSQMPDVTELLNNVTALLDSDIKAEVEDGQRVFREIQLEIQRSVDEHIPSVSVAIAETGRRLEGVADSITYLAGNTSAKLQQHSAAADTLQQLYQQYGPYRRYVGIGAACALLLMTVLLVWGLVCGVCGKRPDVYGASDCCNKGAGSRCLLCGMCVMFVLGGAVALVLAVHFLVGVAAQRFICDPLTEPRDNRLFDDVERFVELERALFNERLDPNFNMTYVLLRCHGNMTLYETFQLHRLYDLEQLKAQMSAEVSRRAAALRPSYPRRAGEPELTILRGSAKRKLAMLAETGLSDFDFDRILDALETNMTSLALDTLAAQLEQTARAVSQRAGFQEVAGSLRNASRRLAAAHTDIVTPMLAGTHALNVTALKLRDGLKFNHSSLKEAISYLMHETSQAETFLNTQGPDLIQNMTREFAEVVAALLEQYLQRVVTAARQDVGRCGPLSHAFNATRDAHCRRILMPTNGYWMSLSWCVVLFVPIMVVAQRLARLYLHVDPYPGPLVEAEYLYDAYADRDNVPLANAYKAEKRAGRDGRRAGRGAESSTSRGSAGGPAAGTGGAGGRGAEAAPVAPPLDAHHARRYNDMAPKHWEEGPPRYHGPTEYERPPPYYYPGPNDRQ